MAQQAMHFIATCTRPPASAGHSLGVAESERMCVDAAEVDAAELLAQDASIASVLHILNHHKFLDKVVDMLPSEPPPPASDAYEEAMPRGGISGGQGRDFSRVLCGAFQVLENLARSNGTSRCSVYFLYWYKVLALLVQKCKY